VRRSLLGLVFLLWGVLPVGSQERAQTPSVEELEDALLEEEELDPDLPPISYEGTLKVGFQDVVLPVMETLLGPLFLLEPIVTSLGGLLHVGPLLESHNFDIQSDRIILGTTSNVMMVSKEILRLSRIPVLSQLGMVVPLEVLEKSYGELLGVGFQWNEAETTLQLRRRKPGTIRMAVDAIELQGTSTIVLEFDSRPRYEVRHRRQAVVIETGNDEIEPIRTSSRLRGSLVRDIEVSGNTVRLLLDPGAAAAEPYELSGSRFGADGFRLVFDVSRVIEPAERTALQGPDRTTPRTIVIDPGHGGEEVGAIGAAGTYEKDLTLALARGLKEKLESRLPLRVVLTRTADEEIPLETRTAVANENKAELFLSLHLNSSRSGRANGAETYFLSLHASDEQSAQRARQENLDEAGEQGAEADELDETEEPEEPFDEDDLGLDLMLWDLAQSQHLADSQRLASLIQGELNGALRLRDRGVRQAPFKVLMGAGMPAVLLELGFLSNPEEEQKLVDPRYRSELLDAVVRAVLRYYAVTERRVEIADR
jgi:N-acetylmuramoyl-L-alanine amidase